MNNSRSRDEYQDYIGLPSSARRAAKLQKPKATRPRVENLPEFRKAGQDLLSPADAELFFRYDRIALDSNQTVNVLFLPN
jgi:hypothetical protein